MELSRRGGGSSPYHIYHSFIIFFFSNVDLVSANGEEDRTVDLDLHFLVEESVTTVVLGDTRRCISH